MPKKTPKMLQKEKEQMLQNKRIGTPSKSINQTVRSSVKEGMNEGGNNVISKGNGNVKTRKRLFGGTVTTSERKDNDQIGYTKTKSKVVENRKGDIVKTSVKKTKYTPTGREGGKLSESQKVGTTKVVKKYKGGSTLPSSVKQKNKSNAKGVVKHMLNATGRAASNFSGSAGIETNRKKNK